MSPAHDGAVHGSVQGATFDTFADRHPDLLDKRLLTRFYRSSTLDLFQGAFP
jgi:hypothetical protein